jgi:hypothetical protein
MEVAQLVAATQWLQQSAHSHSVRLECTGIRSQIVALVSAALEPSLFSEVQIHRGMRSLNYILEAPIRPEAAQDILCLDLYKEFDVDRLVALAQPAKITQSEVLDAPSE